MVRGTKEHCYKQHTRELTDYDAIGSFNRFVAWLPYAKKPWS
jgi:hypothetical protein